VAFGAGLTGIVMNVIRIIIIQIGQANQQGENSFMNNMSFYIVGAIF